MTHLKEFGNYLKQLRTERGLTIRQLTEKSGVSNAYLSQLENGKRGIPKPEILVKLHEPLGVGYDELMEKAGYISSETRSELLPETIKTMNSYAVLSELISNAADVFIRSVTDENGKFKESFRNFVVSEGQAHYGANLDEIKDLLNVPNLRNSIFENLTLDEKILFLNFIIKDFVESGIDPREVFKSNSEKIDDNRHPVLRVPVLGYIAAGQPIFAEEHIDEWTEIPNMWNLRENEVIVLKVKGDSMIGSRIFEGDKVVVKLQPEVENGEIAVVNINGDEATLKRVKKTETGQVILYPDNPKYEPIFITNEKARVIGKVVQVMFEP